ncbi:hypothetical protein B0H11DRAFT_1910208 [Mycena galericulata]|nr:hypothetical protein B0H11DRAFT_1910208 [Mycena galericulata]
MSPLASILETTLAYGDIVFVVEFFRFWDPSTIFLLGQLSYRLLGVVRYYQAAVWGVPKFLSQWFRDPGVALNLLDSAPALFCGPGVMQFFDRNLFDAGRLDLCVGYEGLTKVADFLAAQGYIFRPGPVPRVRDFDLIALVEAAHFPEDQMKVYGERSVTQEEHGSRAFRFIRFDRRSRMRMVVVHLVRTFMKRKSFIACQERAPDTDEVIKTEGAWLLGYTSLSGGIKVVGTASTVDQDAETGRRLIGDGRCWVVPCFSTSVLLEERVTVLGSAFDVIDWRSGVTRHGSYLRIGEPMVWSSWVKSRKRVLSISATSRSKSVD